MLTLLPISILTAIAYDIVNKLKQEFIMKDFVHTSSNDIDILMRVRAPLIHALRVSK